MSAIDSITELTSLLEQWDQIADESADPKALLTRMAELVERETEAWYKMDPDPFDYRHPGRADPLCSLGHLLKALFKNDNLMTKLVNEYLSVTRDSFELNTIACRLLLDVMPGLETTVVFQDNEELVERLVDWAKTAESPLNVFATGLLMGAMEVQNIAASFKDTNNTLVPMMLRRLHKLRAESTPPSATAILQPIPSSTTTTPPTIVPPNITKPTTTSSTNLDRPFANIGGEDHMDEDDDDCSPMKRAKMEQEDGVGSAMVVEPSSQANLAPPPAVVAVAPRMSDTAMGQSSDKENSVSRWADIAPYVTGSYCMWPLKLAMEQRLILQYLTALGEYQELLCHVFEQDALGLLFYYIDLSRNKDVRLAFVAHKYLAALLCHKKFAIEFINMGGVQKLLEVYRPSVAATGVSMCLYYLAYFEVAMERVCLLPHNVISDLVRYVLWLLECSHESGRCHATMFFSLAFRYRVVLEFFDMQDGLRKLYNVISTLRMLNFDDPATTSTMSPTSPPPVRLDDLTEDELFTGRQAARHVCFALKKYFEMHLAMRADQLRRSHVRSEGGSPLAESPAYKAFKVHPDVIQDSIELLLECLPVCVSWQPVSQFIKLGGVSKLLQLVATSAIWTAYTAKAEMIRSALDVLSICTVVPKTQLLLCDFVSLPDNMSTPASSIILNLCSGEVLADTDVQKAALNVIINCVCGPISRFNGGVGRVIGGSAKKKVCLKNGEDILVKMWNSVRQNNGIMVLLKLLMIKMPITEADEIRALDCKALVGLSRSETVRQIISKLPLFNNGHLQQLMKEPVLQDTRLHHLKFCKYANELIEKVLGKIQNSNVDASLEKIRKADVVAQTKIVYQEKELLQLIHEHLLMKGLTDTASLLQKEAQLPGSCPLPSYPRGHSACSSSAYNPCKTPNTQKLQIRNLRSTTPPLPDTHSTGHSSGHSSVTHSSDHSSGHSSAVGYCSAHSAGHHSSGGHVAIHSAGHHHLPSRSTETVTMPTATTTTPTAGHSSQMTTPSHRRLGMTPTSHHHQHHSPVKLNVTHHGTPTQPPAQPPHPQSDILTNQARLQQSQNLLRLKHDSQQQQQTSSALHASAKKTCTTPDTSVSLNKIVTEYLRKQHASCSNPVVTCPAFSLLRPHRCPEPQHRNSAPSNFTARLYRRSITPQYGGPNGLQWNRKFVYSRFRPIRTYSDSEEGCCFSCCAFSHCKQNVILGTYTGELKMFNVETAEEAEVYACHSSPLTHCQQSYDGRLMLTSSSWGTPLSALWAQGESLELKTGFADDHYVEFSNSTQDRIVGTKDDYAHVYDIATGIKVLTLYDANKANNYSQNKATFNPTDHLLLSDGVLWDVTSGRAVHKFDKFNPVVSGLFHPLDREIVINSEVWDMRTFHLLRTVPALDQCHIRFNSAGDIIYGAIQHLDDEEQMEDGKMKSPFGSSFRTFDSSDYSNIATIDVKKDIFDLCTDPTDCYLAVIENTNATDSLADESVCRLYEVGHLKVEEDDEQGDDDEEEDETVHEEDDEEEDEEASDDIADDMDDIVVEDADDDDDEEENEDEDSDDDDDDPGAEMDDSELDDLFFELSDLSNL